MKLKDIVPEMKPLSVSGDLDVEVRGVGCDSRRIAGGDLFVAVAGVARDGRAFVADAVGRGAVGVVHEGDLGAALPVADIRVEDAREALAEAADAFYGHPSAHLTVVGVTGTNGKTTTCSLVRAVLEAAGHRAGQIGTIGYTVGPRQYPASHTTPEAPVFQGLLREMLDAGMTHAVAEVSSHSLAQRRVAATRFRVAVFTNLTRDHLDYHLDMEEYFRAKRGLFDSLGEGTAVVNADDEYGRHLARSHRGRVITYGLGADADLRAEVLASTPDGISMVVRYGGAVHRVTTPLIASVNVYNVLAALGAGLALGLPWERMASGIAAVRGVPGRFEKVECGQGYLVVVDYAHTGDALDRLLRNARGLTSGRVIAVFGCGGDRDRGKRPTMGAAAAALADRVYITTDNPRSEDPARIVGDIVEGIAEGDRAKVSVMPDRAEAIGAAIDEARPGDVVAVAGKGHEEYQESGGVRRHFSDRETAEAAIRERMRREGAAS